MVNKFNINDTVVRTNGTANGMRPGDEAVVVECTYGTIKLEGQGDYTFSPNNFKLVRAAVMPTKSAIATALKILRAAGEVQFKPYKPPFKPITIIVGTYDAVVSEQSITVGCTNISFDVAEKLWNAVLEAKKYNAQA